MSGVLAGLNWRHAAVPFGVIAAAAIAVSIWAGIGPVAMAAGEALTVGGLIVLLWLLVAGPLALRAGRAGMVALLVVGLLFLVNLVGLSLPRAGFFAGLDWNWQGKTVDLVWCLLLVALLGRVQRREIGWTWQTRPGSLPVAFINIAILAAAGFLLGGTGQVLTSERVLFDTTYPNLVEEIVFRGFMLALLDRAFPPGWTVSGARIGWGVVLTAWLFGLAHGVAITPDGIVFDPGWLAITFVAGLVFGWIRALTGSLWPAFLAHCAPEIGVLFAIALR